MRLDMGKKTKNTGPNFIIRDILSINFCTKLVRVYRADNITFVVVYSTILKMRQAEERRNRNIGLYSMCVYNPMCDPCDISLPLHNLRQI